VSADVSNTPPVRLVRPQPWEAGPPEGWDDEVKSEPAKKRAPRTPAEILEAMTAHPVVHAPTKIAKLDEMTGGGPRFHDLVSILGVPDGCKTMLLAQLADVYAESDSVIVGAVMFDEDDESFVTRLAQRRNWLRAEIEQRIELDDLGHRLPQIWIYDATWTLEESIVDLESRATGKRVVLCVDSLQTVNTRVAADAKSQAERVSATLRILKGASMRGWLVFFTSEKVRSAYSGIGEKTTTLASAKWSGDVEYASKIQIGVGNVPGDDDMLEVEVSKNKAGPRGKFFLRIDRAHQRLTECDAPKDPEPSAKRDRKAEGDSAKLLAVIVRHPGAGSRDLRRKSGLGPASIDRALELLEQAGRIENRPEQHGQRSDAHYFAISQSSEGGES
jgi:hypothetical protein